MVRTRPWLIAETKKPHMEAAFGSQNEAPAQRKNKPIARPSGIKEMPHKRIGVIPTEDKAILRRHPYGIDRRNETMAASSKGVSISVSVAILRQTLVIIEVEPKTQRKSIRPTEHFDAIICSSIMLHPLQFGKGSGPI